MVNETKDDIFTEPTVINVKKDCQEQIAVDARALNHGIDKSNTKNKRNFFSVSIFVTIMNSRSKNPHSAVGCCFLHNGYLGKFHDSKIGKSALRISVSRQHNFRLQGILKKA